MGTTATDTATRTGRPGYESALLLAATPTTRRRKAATGPMLGDKVVALRQLAGAERKAAERRFLREAKGFVRSVCAWYHGDDLDRDDVEQTATAALWSAVADWETGRAPFDTLARWRMRGALAKLLRGSRIVRGSDRGCLVEIDDEMELSSGSDPERELLQKEAVAEVAAALALLPDHQRRILAAVLLDGQPVAAYAQELGLKVAEARRQLSAAKDDMATMVMRRRRGVL